MAVTLNTPGKRGPDASDRVVRQRLCSEENVQGPLCQPLPEEIWKIVAEHLQGPDLKNLSKVSDVCQQAALREKNIQEMNTAIKELQALSNLNPAAPKGSKSALDVYQHILLAADNRAFDHDDFYDDAMIDPDKLPDLQQKLHELSTKKAAAVFESLKHTCFQNIQDKKASITSIEEQYNRSKCALVVEALELKISSDVNEETARCAAVVVAAQKGHLKILQALLANGENDDVKYCFSDALYEAAKDGHLEIVQFLLENGIVRFLLEHGADYEPALEIAAQKGHLEIVQFLLANKGRLSEFDIGKAVWCAADEGHLEIVRLLLANKGRLSAFDIGQAVEYAARNGHLEIVKVLLANGQISEGQRSEAVEDAAKYGHLEIVKFLLADGAQISEKQKSQAICKAAKNGHLEIVQALLAHGEITKRSRNEALVESIINNKSAIFKVILQNTRISQTNNQDFEERISWGSVQEVKLCSFESADLKANFQRFLILAASKGNKDVVEYLLTQEIILENMRTMAIEAAQNNHHTSIVEVLYKYTPCERSILAKEALRGQLDRVQHILKHSEISAPERGLALAIAAYNGHLEIVKVLMGHGFINQDRRAYALKLAIEEGRLEIVKELLAKGPIDRIDKAEAFMLASQGRHQEILSILAQNR